ncbi:MAG: stage II sporulation protein M [Anaerolineae bacterium]|nr:stage II sporulation protein M [Anaerolineae bacterium]MDW8102540.1 stage II sporulation protein M [Anaerolineae bacterium]
MSSLLAILTLVSKELKDSLRDWRIMAPIAILTLFFPWLMDITAQLARDFVLRYGAFIIAERMYPFLLMVVGFFPITFSLVIALESFVGEKERLTLEPLLASPLSDLELFLGKFLASLILPLGASFLGISIYVAGLYYSTGYFPPLVLLAQILILTFCEALVMVAGAVVISHNATSVRAANLLASFIIVPMALAVQGISIAMFWANYNVIWLAVAGMFVVTVLLVRMGLALFNREHLLTTHLERFDFRSWGEAFGSLFLRRPGNEGKSLSLMGFYRRELGLILTELRLPLIFVGIMALAGLAGGLGFAFLHPYPELILPEDFDLSKLKGVSWEFLPPLQTRAIFFHNLRTLTLSSLLSIVTLGVMPSIAVILNMGLLGFVGGEIAILGQKPLLFAAFILPHGIFEIPAAILAIAAALRVGAVPVSPAVKGRFREALLLAIADWVKILLFIAIPLLLIAAFVEANITPIVVRWLYE